MMKKSITICIISSFIFMLSCDSKKPVTSKINDAKIMFSVGEVKIKVENAWDDAKENMKLTEKNEVKTGKGAQCNILIGAESYLSIKENSHIVIAELMKNAAGFEDNTIELKVGKSVINPKKLLKGDSFRVKTPTAIAAVRGTQFVVESEPEGDIKVAVVEGKVELKRRVPVLEKVEKTVITKSEVLTKLSAKIEEETVIVDSNHSALINNVKALTENKIIEDVIVKHSEELKSFAVKKDDVKVSKDDMAQKNIQSEKAMEKALSDLDIMKNKKVEEKQIILTKKIKNEDQKDVKELSEFINNVKDKVKNEQKPEERAELEIKSPVKEGAIYVNSKLFGYDSVKLNPVPGGRLEILVTAKGYEDYKSVIILKNGENKKVEAELKKYPVLTVMLPVKNGKIYINSNYSGLGSATYSSKPGSMLLIEVEAPGFKKFSTEIVLNTGDEKILNIPLEKIKDLDRIKWSEKFGSQILTSPVFYKEKLIISSSEGQLISTDREGNRIWKADLKRGIESAPVIYNDSIYVVTTYGDFYSIRFQDGGITWKKKIYGSLLFGSRPLIADGKIYLASSYGRIYSFDVNGNEIWHKDIMNGIYTSPEYREGVIYLGAEDHKLYALSSKSGDILWTFKVDSRMVSSSPAIINKTLFVGCYSGTFYAVDIEKGKEKWKFRTGDSVFSTPAADSGRLYFGSNDGYLYSVSSEDGSIIWKFNTGNRVVTKPVIKNSIVYVTSGNQIFAISTITGKSQWNHIFFNTIKTSATVEGNDIFVGLDNGEVASVRDSLKEIYR